MDYIKGFNHGYAFQKKSPEMAEILSKDFDKIKGYGEGFKHGRKEYVREQEQKSKKQNPLKEALEAKQRTASKISERGKDLEK